jgi:hypothetical protein
VLALEPPADLVMAWLLNDVPARRDLAATWLKKRRERPSRFLESGVILRHRPDGRRVAPPREWPAGTTRAGLLVDDLGVAATSASADSKGVCTTRTSVFGLAACCTSLLHITRRTRRVAV